MDFKTMLDFHLPPDRNTLAEDRTCKQARPAHPHRTLPDVTGCSFRYPLPARTRAPAHPLERTDAARTNTLHSPRIRQLEAAASTADSTVHTADAAKEYAPLQRAEGARTGPEKTPREPQDRGHGPIDAAARPRMCMRLRGGGQSEVLRVIRKNVDGVSSNVARFNTLCQQRSKQKTRTNQS